jgi:Uma2 family endonuclease
MPFGGADPMAAKPTRRLFTVAEYYQMGCAGILARDERVELIEGEIIQMPPIGVGHAFHVDRIMRLFAQVFGDTVHLRVQNPIHLGDRSEPVPDVMLLQPRVDSYATHHPTPTDVLLLVEVSDTTVAFDTKVKLPLYASEGVAEVWIVDLNVRAVRVNSGPTQRGYQISETKGRGERLTPSAFPERSFLVDDILS